MYNYFAKNGPTIAMLVGTGITIIFLVAAVIGMGADGYDVGADLAGQGREKVMQMNYFDTGLILTLILLAISLVLYLIFGVWTIMKFPKSLKSTLISSGLIAGVFLALYFTATRETTGKLAAKLDEFQISDGVNRFVSAGLWLMIILSVVAILLMIAMEVRNMFK